MSLAYRKIRCVDRSILEGLGFTVIRNDGYSYLSFLCLEATAGLMDVNSMSKLEMRRFLKELFLDLNLITKWFDVPTMKQNSRLQVLAKVSNIFMQRIAYYRSVHGEHPTDSTNSGGYLRFVDQYLSPRRNESDFHYERDMIAVCKKNMSLTQMCEFLDPRMQENTDYVIFEKELYYKKIRVSYNNRIYRVNNQKMFSRRDWKI
jgi:hypothetical protein